MIEEAGKGDLNAASKRIEAISDFMVLKIDEDAAMIAKNLLSDGAIPQEYPEDAIHIAVASINRMTFILTWNFAHINNAIHREKIIKSVDQCGYTCPVICTPEELLGG